VRNGLPAVLLLNRTFADCSEQSRLIVPSSVNDLFIGFAGQQSNAIVKRE
jgi:hypothetical protein